MKNRNTLTTLILAIVSFTLSPATWAQLSPPPDGGYGDQSGSGETTAEGTDALFHNCWPFNCVFGDGPQDNTAIGFDALYNNLVGKYNTGIGANVLRSNTSGNDNTASGFGALFSNQTGGNNTASGAYGLYSNQNGGNNTASGEEALYHNVSGYYNTASGAYALYSNQDGENNTASGEEALYHNVSGYYNTASGAYALFANQNGGNNTAVGSHALFVTTGSNNIALGASAGSALTTGSNNIDIGANVGGVAREANTIRIGKSGTQQKTFIAGISGKTVASGVGVIVGTTGQLGTVVSSARFKEAIKPMDKASEAILALKPVTFRYKKELDPDKIPQFGLIAEEVEKVNPELVARDEEGKIMSVRYEAVNAMLLNEFLKEHRTVQDLKAVVVHQQKQIETLTTGLMKVSAELELSKPSPQTVLNNR